MARSINGSTGIKRSKKRKPAAKRASRPSKRSAKSSNPDLPQWFEKGKEPEWFKKAIKDWKDSTVRMPD